MSNQLVHRGIRGSSDPSGRSLRRAGGLTLIAMLAGGLVASVALNVWLARATWHSYLEVRRLRFDPAEELVQRPAPQATDEAASPLPVIVLFGDSRVAQWDPLPAVAGHRVVNLGRSGQTTAQLLLRADEVLRHRPVRVLLQLGINDLVTADLLRLDSAVAIQAARRNIDRLIRRLHACGVDVVLMPTIPPADSSVLRSWFHDPAAVRRAVDALNARLMAAPPEGARIIDIRIVLAPKGAVLSCFATDDLHWNSAAYAQLNRVVEPLLAAGSQPSR